MPIKVHYASRFAAAADRGDDVVQSADNLRVADVLSELVARHGDEFRQVVFATEGVLQPAVMICVNDQQIIDPLEHQLSDGDEILILSAISGG